MSSPSLGFIFAIVVISLVSVGQVAADASNTWTFNFNNIGLFNLPALGRSIFGVTDSPSQLTNSVEHFQPEFDIDPDVIEDSFLKTVGVCCSVLKLMKK